MSERHVQRSHAKDKEVSDKDLDGGDKRKSMGRRRSCKFCSDASIKIDYKDASLLKYFITDRGKLVPAPAVGQLRQAPAGHRHRR